MAHESQMKDFDTKKKPLSILYFMLVSCQQPASGKKGRVCTRFK